MLYIFAVTCPPLACFCAGEFWRSVLASLLCVTLVLYPVAVVLAWYTVKESYRPRRGRGATVVVVR